MADNRIELIAELNPDDSIKEIKKNLESITNELNKNPIEIKCRIAQSSISDIQNQLGKLTKGININVNANSIQKGLEVNKTNLTQQAKEIEKALNLVYPKGHTEEHRAELKRLLADYQQAYDIEGGWGEQAQKNMTELIRFANSYRQEISLTNDDLRDTQEEIKRIKREQQQLFITADQYNALDKYARDNKTNAKNMLDKALGAGRWSADANTYKFDKPYYWGNFAESVNQINPLRDAIIDEGDIIQGIKDLSEFMDKSFIHIDDTLEKNEEAYIQWGNTVIETINSVSGINTFADQWETFDPDSVEETIQEVQKLTSANEAAAQAAKKIEYPKALDVKTNTDEILANAKKVIGEGLAQSAETAGDKVTRVTKAVEDAEGKLQSFIVQVEKENKSIETLTYALNEEGEAYEYLGKTIREADNSTDLSTQWDIQTEKLIQFANNADKAGFASNELKEDIQNLFIALNKANPAFGGDTSTMNAFLDNFDIAKAKLQSLNAIARKNNFADALQNKIKKLSADMQAYAVANDRAIDSQKKMSTGQTFAAEWVRLTTEMAKGAELTDAEVKKLAAEFRIFGKEAEAAGLKGENALGKFLNSFKVISTYFSASRFITLVTSQIRSAISELQTVDERLTEIWKTSNRTEESLRRLGETSFQTASQYGRTASDYLLGVQEMSRAGFGETQSEKLAELSVLAQAAGDMTAEMANQYLIATNAAYKLEGNEEKLNQVLDSQNYITNHNAVNMENLAEATKIAASQAAASGVAIDELTAAVGTMVATTQQGGDQAGRAFKGILMNIQQVKASAADIGDGGADITAESLSKYEKASAALGVSLKEVKNGTIQLREPMEVLRDLSEAVGKESENSIKVANLISAVGGKFRGNQLIALLQNWETYEKMLSEYNSEEAIDSAIEEAEKSANNWAGSINKVKNSWAELVSQFADSENMKSMLSSINEIIKSITDSATTGGLKALSDLLADLLKGISLLAEKFGALPTVLTSVAAVMGLKGYGLFPKEGIANFGKSLDDIKIKLNSINNAFSTRKLYNTRGINLTGLSEKDVNALQEYVDLISKGTDFDEAFAQTMKDTTQAAKNQTQGFNNLYNSYKYGIITQKQYEAATKDITVAQKAATVASKALSTALNTIVNIGISLLISSAIKLIDKFIHAEEDAAEKEREVRQEIESNLSARKQEIEETDSLLTSYIELASITSDLSSEKDKLLDIQEKLNASIDDQKEKIDLLNGSLSENIELVNQQRLAEAKRIIAENQANYDLILKGEQASADSMQTFGDKDVDKAVAAIQDATGMHISGTLSEQSEQLEKMLEAYRNIDGYNKSYYNDLVRGKQAIDDELASWRQVKDAVETAQKTVEELTIPPEMQKSFDGLVDKAKQLYDEINGEGTVEEKFLASEKLKQVKDELYDLVGDNAELTNVVDTLFSSFEKGAENSIKSVGNLKEAWLATLDDMQKGSLKNISTMVSALQDLSEGKGIASNTFWSLVEFDEEGMLNGAKLIGDRYQISLENMIKLKDRYVNSQIESLLNQQEEIYNQKIMYEADVKRYELQAAAMREAKEDVTKPQEYRRILDLLDKAKTGAKEFGDEWERNNWLIEYLNQNLGNTVDIEKQLQAQQKQLNKELTALNKELDNYVKAHETVIDGIVKGLEEEQHQLENQKQTLEDELDVLEKQKDAVEDIIDKYETASSYVQKIVEKEIKSLEEQRDAIKNTYDERIKALKEENEEREDAYEYAQKLANLENAKNNKRRVYDEARGWRYESVKEDVVKAENDLKSYENSQSIKAVEKERDAEIEAWDKLIKTKQDYADLWKDILDEIKLEEEEAIAQEVLGAEYREKIAEGDITLLDKFTSEYRTHNTELKRLTDVEIKHKKEAIDAKNKEIEANKQRITSWKDLKSNLSSAVTEIKTANEGYMKQIGEIQLNETSSLEERERAFETFKTKVTGYIQEIGNKQSLIDNITESLEKIQGGSYSLSFEVEGYDQLTNVENTLQRIVDKMKGVQILNAAEIAQMMDEVGIGDVAYGEKMAAFLRKLLGYSSGGVADYTGLAMLHGRKNAPEIIFNANDSAKLYEMVHNTPNLMADMLNQATKLSGFKLSSNENTNNSTANTSIYIDKIVTNNPEDFARQLDRYYRTKLTESYTNK